MFKTLTATISNATMSANDISGILTAEMPKWDWQITSDKGAQFEVRGKRRWHRLYIKRDQKGNIHRTSDTSLLWGICTFGLTWFLGDSTAGRHRQTLLTVLEKHVHRPS